MKENEKMKEELKGWMENYGVRGSESAKRRMRMGED